MVLIQVVILNLEKDYWDVNLKKLMDSKLDKPFEVVQVILMLFQVEN